MKLKLKEPAREIDKRASRARKAAPQPKASKVAKPARGGMDDERADNDVKEPPVKMRTLTFHVPDDGRIPRLALLNRRHDDWLVVAARQEGRTPEGFLDRLVRLAWSKDSTKGGQFADKLGGDGHARGRAEHGHSGSHPARGNE